MLDYTMEYNPADALKNVVRPQIHVTLEKDGVPQLRLKFYDRFTIGSDPSCDVVLPDTDVSGVHAEVWYERGAWHLKDLGSKTGTFINGKQTTEAVLEDECRVLFGVGGQMLTFDVRMLPHHVVTKQLREVFRATGYVPVALYRTVLRRGVRRFLRLQSKKYVRIIGALAVVAALAGVYAYLKHEQVRKQEALAQDVFYEMKEFELTLARLEDRVRQRGDTTSEGEISMSRSRLRQLSASYEKYISELGVYHEGMDETDKLIYHVARVFGECELTMPEDFATEVRKYIGVWKLSNRLPKAIEKANAEGYGARISEALLAQQLPPQFFFLALQESEFDSAACGPATRYGIAKGMWQFIPSTALEYGLRTGPLVALPRLDPKDQRHRVDLASTAAARYLRDIYNGEAQASGLLVLASYNWGHNAVRGLIRALPENPRERNFWKFLSAYRKRIPKETYDYVFLICSAAVIGENPALFGFSFPKPLPDAAQ
ncbi:MAG: FHA domain-containing protein [Bacteroidetes bacterium]|nr:FHA domain-containing protein [Bacteroidota bacterium]